jgi:EAL domain-containing protein (putative c-di-GMP-specific phosphodiesterase class I)/ActR/RegA family two-component response regulator
LPGDSTLLPSILVADDDQILLRAYARVLTTNGYRVETAADGQSALEAFQKRRFDLILSDIDMPGLSGIELLEAVRAHDLDVPVVLVTGTPEVDSTIRAIEYGALRYLVKPIETAALVKVAGDAVRLHRIAKAKRQALTLLGGSHLVGDHAGLVASFGRALDAHYVAYQPIVSWSEKRVTAYEVLLRSREASLPDPGAMLDAAERLGRVHELGRSVRKMAVERARELLSDDTLLFVNLHPSDLADPELLSRHAPLAALAERVVLEITERASLDEVPNVRDRIMDLRRLGYRIALDDLGAGYAGLSSFALLEPDFVKLDMTLTRNLGTDATKQTLVRTMASMCQELGMCVVAEGIETIAERDELERAGCDLMQGFLFAEPGDAFPVPRF